jgi:hypothetical protein
MSKDDPCNCPHCRLKRGFDEIATGDFLAQARLAAARGFPAVKRMAESLYSPEWKDSSISEGCFLMLVGAALFHEATAAMAAESHRRADVEAMLIGIKAYGLTFDFMVHMDQEGMTLEAAPGPTDPDDRGVRH